MKNFLADWQKSGSQVQAAQEAFGDLKQFGKRIEGYSRQQSVMVGLIKSGQEAEEKTYTARSVSPAEATALRADFHNPLEQVQPVFQEAAQAEPNLAFAHEALGYYHYRKHELSQADAEIQEALKLGATGFAPQYLHGIFLMQQGRVDKQTALEAQKSLEKAIQLNPQFAPAFEGLSQAYEQHSASGNVGGEEGFPGGHLARGW